VPHSAHLKDIGSTDAEAAEQIRRWFAKDAEGRRRLEFYANPADWFALLGPSRHGWFVIIGEEPVGLIDMEVNDGCGYIAYYVAPDHRGQGYGTETVRLMIEQARTLGLTSLDGGVDVDNIASIAALKKNVSTFDDVDDEGMFPVRITL
jgi:RimJ/RimL family protein N-acetyltransferase